MQFVSNLIVAVGLGAILLAQSLAANPTVHEGVVVSAGAGQLTMKDKSGKQHSHPIGREVKITVHGKPGMLEDLQLGMPIRVTVDGSKVLGISTIDNIK